MKYLLFTLFLLTFLQTKAQFALVESNDGFVNLRESSESGSKIIQKLNNGSIVMVDEIEYSPEQNWLYVKIDEEKSGYIHKSGLKFIHSLTKGNVNLRTENSIQISLNEYELNISTKKFERKNYQITYKDNKKPNSEQVLKINGKDFWGTDFSLPNLAYNKMWFKSKGKTINLNTDGLFNPNLKTTNIFINKATNSIYIIAQNSDGAGSYSALWLIENGKFTRRIGILTA
ncbi:MAG: SH3 domain-containing protein [Bacteroidia bacterium]